MAAPLQVIERTTIFLLVFGFGSRTHLFTLIRAHGLHGGFCQKLFNVRQLLITRFPFEITEFAIEAQAVFFN